MCSTRAQKFLYLAFEFVPGRGIRHFALEGIKKAERMKERFEVPEGFSISEYLNVPFGLFDGRPITVKVIFDKKLSDYIQRRTWHPSEKTKQPKDGRTLLTITASGKEEIKVWILGFGGKVETVLPTSLREEIRTCLSKNLARCR